MEFERASKLARRGELVEAQAREVLKDIMKRADTGETLQSMSIKSHFDTWLAGKKTRQSNGTWKRYGVTVEDFLKTLGNRASQAPYEPYSGGRGTLFESSDEPGTCARHGDP